jgi:general secretion pathway protein C
MNRIAIWIATGTLFVLCCYLAAAIVNEVLAEVLAPGVGLEPARAQAPVPTQRTWEERQVILERNVFKASTGLGEALPEELQEQYEATKLPVRLLATVASGVPALSWAAIEDTQKRESSVVRLQDQLVGRATVVAIERRRVVLENRGQREELAFEEGGQSAARPAPRRAAPSRDVSSLRDRVRRLQERRSDPEPERPVEIAGRSPAEIFSSARILPKYDEGQMVGIQLNNVKAGSLFEEAGIRDGDVITQFNGIQIDNPQASAQVLRELTEADRFEVSVTREDGSQETLSFSP